MSTGISKWYEAALLQMASECYFEDIARDDVAQVALQLLAGNNRRDAAQVSDPFTGFTRFTDVQANEFVEEFAIVHQASDNPRLPRSAPVYYEGTSILANSGLSATLVRNRETGAYTLAIRSTEFRKPEDGGDRDRDAIGADLVGLSFNGLALAQLSTLEDYYGWLKQSGKLPAGSVLDVTGYSLGGHLATVFTEMHANDADISFGHTYTFNGAGRGTWARNADNPSSIVAFYKAVLTDPNVAFSQVGATNETVYLQALSLARAGTALDPLSSYKDARHAWAQLATRERFGLSQLNPFDLGPADLRNGAADKITQLFGRESPHSPTFVANTGVHGNTTGIFVEAQPFLEGDVSLANHGVADWGNGHAVVLVADALALMRVFEILDPSVDIQTLNTLLSAASNKFAQSGVLGTDGVKAEDDALELALDSLRQLVLGRDVEPTPYIAGPSGFGDFESRSAFHANLDELTSSPTFQALAGRVQVKALAGLSAEDLASLADGDIAYRYAIKELNPFAIVGAPELYDPFNEASELYLEEEGGALTARYLADRAAMLHWKLARNEANAQDLLVGEEQVGGAVFVDASENGPTIRVINALQARAGVTQAALARSPRFFFAAAQGSTFEGGPAGDALYGSAGDDTLSGSGGEDYLEGAGGADRLAGGADADQLLGGTGDDRLEGGSGNDDLQGASGFDTYVYSAGDGQDEILDSDGLGRILYNGRQLAGGHRVDRFAYKDEAGTRYALVGAGATQGLLIDGAILVRSFTLGQLGIALEGQETAIDAPEINATVHYSNSRFPDGIAKQEDGEFYLPFLPSAQYFLGTSQEDSVVANDRAYDTRGGDDSIVATSGALGANGGAGGDYIDASAATAPSSLAGGSGADHIVGGSAADVISGDNTNVGIRTGIVPGASIDGFEYGLRLFTSRILNAPSNIDSIVAGWGGHGVFVDRLEAELSVGDLPYADLSADIQAAGWNFGSLENFITYVLGVEGSFDDFIDAGDGADRVTGGSGDDVILGGAGADTLVGDYDALFPELTYAQLSAAFGLLASRFGAPGDDHIDGGDGDDVISDMDGGNDTLIGGSGDDVLTSAESGLIAGTAYNYLDGGAGNDTISASGDAFNVIVGGDGADSITFSGEAIVDGGLGNDTYVYLGAGSAWMRITDEGGDDTLSTSLFAALGLAPSLPSAPPPPPPGIGGPAGPGPSLPPPPPPAPALSPKDAFAQRVWSGPSADQVAITRISREGQDLVFATPASLTPGAEARIVLDRWFAGPANRIELFSLAPGSASVMTAAEFERWGSSQVGTNEGESLEGGEFIDRIIAAGGDDFVAARDGDDLIAGGAGNDYLDGGSGDDTYYFASGDGNDAIVDGAGSDELRFGAGISLADISAVNGASWVTLALGGDSIDIARTQDGASPVVERLVFADGTSASVADLLGAAPFAGSEAADALDGNDAPNRLRGGPGDDLLRGLGGSDTYEYRLGDGIDRISDLPSGGDTNTLAFGPGITLDMLRLGTGSLTIRVGSGGDEIHLEGVDPADITGAHDIDVFTFDDGTQLTYAQLISRGLDVEGTSFEDVLMGSSTVDRFTGGRGDDLLLGAGGSDTYFYGAGDGADVIVESVDGPSQNSVVLQAGITASQTEVLKLGQDLKLAFSAGDSITVPDWFSGSDAPIAEFRFADGTSWSASDASARAVEVVDDAPAPSDPAEDVGAASESAAAAPTTSPQAVLEQPVPSAMISVGAVAFEESEPVSSNSAEQLARDSGPVDPMTNDRRQPAIHVAEDAVHAEDQLTEPVAREDSPHTAPAASEAPVFEPGYRPITLWDVGAALTQLHLERSDVDAYVDGVAFPYGKNGLFAGLSLNAAQERIGAMSFGGDAQSMRQFEGLREGFAFLG